MLGDGAGGFGPATNFTVGFYHISIISTDFNGDGKADLAMTGDTNKVSVLLGDGAGGFGAATKFAVVNNPWSVTSADFNGDGKADLATANLGSNNVSVLLGDGAGNFSPAVNFATADSSISVITSDFNGDGKADLAVANQGPNNIFVLLLDVPSVPVVTVNDTTTFCEGDSVSLQSSIDNNIQWNTGDTTQNINVNESGNYFCTYTDVFGCSATSNAISVNVLPASVFTGNDTALLCGSSFQLNPVTNPLNLVSVVWTPSAYLSASGILNPFCTPSSPIQYVVTVQFSNGCSAKDSIFINQIMPSSIPICLVTVDSTSTQNFIIWEKPVTFTIDSFKIYREIGLNNYVFIGSVPYSALSEFTDTTNGVNPKIQSYRYKIITLDTCGNESVLSSHHRTIHLSTPIFTAPKTFDLIWTNDYEGFSFSQYFILRDGNGTGNWVKIDSVTYGNLSYTDINAPSANAGYLVEAKHPTGCDATLKLKTYNASKSNTAALSAPGAINEFSNDGQSFIITPNPNMGIFTLQITNNELRRAITEVKIFNILGEVVFQSEIRQQKFEINLKQPAGICNVQITGNGILLNKKVAIQ